MEQINQRWGPVGELRVTLPVEIPLAMQGKYNSALRAIFGPNCRIHWLSSKQYILEASNDVTMEYR